MIYSSEVASAAFVKQADGAVHVQMENDDTGIMFYISSNLLFTAFLKSCRCATGL